MPAAPNTPGRFPRDCARLQKPEPARHLNRASDSGLPRLAVSGLLSVNPSLRPQPRVRSSALPYHLIEARRSVEDMDPVDRESKPAGYFSDEGAEFPTRPDHEPAPERSGFRRPGQASPIRAFDE